MNALMQSRCTNGEHRSQSPMRNSSNGPVGINSYAMGGTNDSAFARSPLGVKRVATVQPSYQIRQQLERAENAGNDDPRQSYSPMRKKSRSPQRQQRAGSSNSPARVAAALQSSQGVGQMNF
eukprot:CAMPEP_0185576578 /NCGR_PEP_ID=MMETSP0434-20130131/7477_1 /TAXON_ID=626734 ORGANISM="Favella taraikaensis, Strain Fe Narragansett Bay" /NCGR_SAMPLE_ID=MMETSP0434 /ASSEMBLY_ACC=CAM_ASM_000379 /LENGTH=121 /DNA_ID=CAMNT_0028193839 /DNA_START=1014 /DNA_END=1379 /DNA_ORIENTATION=+